MPLCSRASATCQQKKRQTTTDAVCMIHHDVGKSAAPAAVRMRRLRDRRRRGFRVALVEISQQDMQALITTGVLDRALAADLSAVEAAIGKVLDRLAERYR
jgi:hypothetical protein